MIFPSKRFLNYSKIIQFYLIKQIKCIVLGQKYKINTYTQNKKRMFQSITTLIEQIKQHQHLHKVTIFNKGKNNQNMHAHNVAEGKLIELLKQFPYFSQLNQNLGVQYLQKAINLIEPYFLRKDRVLVNAKVNNYPAEYLLVQGILAVFKFKEQQNKSIQHVEQNQKKSLSLQKYLSNEQYLTFSDYKQDQFQLISHVDCCMLKLPNKNDLDPVQYAKKNADNYRQTERNSEINKFKGLIDKCIRQVRKQKSNLQISSTFGLSSFDFNQLLSKAQIQKVPNNARIYQSEETIQKVGLILKGKIIQQDTKMKVKKFVAYDNAILTIYKKKYNADANKVQKNQTVLEQLQWIGLQQFLVHLESSPFRLQSISANQQNLSQDSIKKFLQFISSRQVRAAQDSQILWIPVVKFAAKFNYQANFTTLDQWKTIIDMKQETKSKNDKIHEQLEDQKKQREIPKTKELPQLNHGKLVSLGHHINDMQKKTEFKSKLIWDKHRKFGKLRHNNVKISETSLLGITMKQNFDFQAFTHKKPQKVDYKKFSYFSRSTLSKKFDSPANLKDSKNQAGMIRSRKALSLNRIEPHQTFYQFDDSPEDLIMYPQAYEPTKLPPDLRKQLFQAQRSCRLQAIDQSLPSKHRVICLQNSRLNLIENQSLVKKNLSSIASKGSLNMSVLSNSVSPQRLYKGMVQKISFKYPSLQQSMLAEKDYKRQLKPYQKVNIKQRLNTLKILEQIERKKAKKLHYLSILNSNLEHHQSNSLIPLYEQQKME